MKHYHHGNKNPNYRHGMCNTDEYEAYFRIKARCYRLKSKDYNLYGGRGIKMSAEWLNSFEQFYKDMGPRPSKKHSIDRIDNDGNYCKENCRWALGQTQGNNKRRNGKTSKYYGVHFSFYHNRWVATINVDKKHYFLGNHKNELDAALAYNIKAIELLGDEALLNDIWS